MADGSHDAGNAYPPRNESDATDGIQSLLFFLYVYAPVALGLLSFGTAAVILEDGAGAAAKFHWIVATVAIFAAFFFGNKFAIGKLAEGCAAGDVLSLVTACLWFPFSALVVVTLTFVGIAFPVVENLQLTQFTAEVRSYHEGINRQQKQQSQASGEFGACDQQLTGRSQCERSNGCVSGRKSGVPGTASPIAEFLRAAAGICRKGAEDFTRALRDQETKSLSARDAIAAFETARSEALPKGVSRRSHLYQRYMAVADALERMNAVAPVAMGKAIAEQLKAANPGVVTDVLREGSELARAELAREGDRIAEYFAKIDDRPRPLPSWPDATPLVAAFNHLDQVWLHLLAAIGAEALPLLLFVFAIGAERKRQQSSGSRYTVRHMRGWP